ncbi:MAG: Kef-type ransport system, predicted NAD-binding component [Solirubrobacterales bacterium]|nr:Kef-type ransport system, predicted NAD-binding component [Solirubrobacterales bacterium]
MLVEGANDTPLKLPAMDAPSDARAVAYERYFEKPLIIAAVLSIPTTILQNTTVGEPWAALGLALNWLIWLAFLSELAVMLMVVPDRRAYLRKHPLDLAIVVLTPPFLINFVQNLRLLRLLRLFRLLRLAPLARAMFSFEGVKAISGLAVLTAVAGGGGFAAEEGKSFGDGVYWAITTMTTVGYGDIHPERPEGKVLAIVVMLVGIGTATLLIGAVAQRFLAHSVEHVESTEDDVLVEVREISLRLGRLEQRLQRERATRP